ncbi:MAG: maleylpyruvate isomerase family mycothiol-dependent enzyme [Mycobacteriales bacterium]
MSAALRAADPAAAIPSCPGWTVRALAAHLTAVHRWAHAALLSEDPPPYDETPIEGDLGAAYERAARALVTALHEVPPEQPCWTFDRGNRTASFWRRRQLHEVAVHRWDVAPYALSDEVAKDGIDEVLDFFLPRQIAGGRTEVPAGTLRLVDLDEAWAFGEGRPVTTAHGTSSDLLLGLWGRLPLDLGPWGEVRLTP